MAGKKFRFSLESVLHLRQHETHLAQEELAAVRQQKRAQEERVVQAHRHLAELLQQGPSGCVGQCAIRQYDAYRHAAQRSLEDERRELRRYQELEEEARAWLMEKRTDEESLRKLHEEEARRHRKSVAAAETAFLDEQALTTYHRQQNGTY